MTLFKSSSPGSIMLFGEHSVLAGFPAMGIAVDQFLNIEWHVDDGCSVSIISELGNYQSTWDDIGQHPKLNFVIATLQQFAQVYPQIKQVSLELNIQSYINPFWGLGSSAAVTAAVLSGLAQISCELQSREKISLNDAFTIGLKAIRQVQGGGSGTDLAISLAGGCVGFHPKTQQITSLTLSLPFTLVYLGYKTPTPEVLKWVEKQWENNPDGLQQIYKTMGEITYTALAALKTTQANTLENLGALMNQYQLLMQDLGVADEQTNSLLAQLHSNADFLGVKISGSGLGDCVIALGKSQQLYNNQITLNSTSKGAWV